MGRACPLVGVSVVTLAAFACVACSSAPSPPPAVAPRLILADAAPAQAPASDAPLADQEKSAPETEHHARQGNRTWGWTFLAIGVDAAILAVVTSGMMLHQLSVRNASCDRQKSCSSDGIAANGKLADMAPWNAMAWGIAAVATPLGVYFLLTNPTDAGVHAQVGAGPTGSGTGMVLRGEF